MPSSRIVLLSSALIAAIAFPPTATAAKVADRDRDGMADAWERANKLNPRSKGDARSDKDKDELTALAEFKARTNPRKPDSDGDGMKDGYEVRFNLKPRDKRDGNADGDRDGIRNRDEAKLGTSPRSADSDGDGVGDKQELVAGTDPTAKPKPQAPPPDASPAPTPAPRPEVTPTPAPTATPTPVPDRFIVTTIAGSTTSGDSGDGGPATQALFTYVSAVAFDAVGRLLIADYDAGRVRAIDLDGTISTRFNVAVTDFEATPDGGMIAVDGFGGGLKKFAADGTWVRKVASPAINSVTVGPDGRTYFTDGNAVKELKGDGSTVTVAGGAGAGYAGDGGLATDALLHRPLGLAVAGDGSLYIADSRNNAIRRVAPNGIIATVMGNGPLASCSHLDGAFAVAQLCSPKEVAVDNAGNVYAVTFSRIRKIANGTVSTVIGGGHSGYVSGAVGSGISFANVLYALTRGPDGSLYFADGEPGTSTGARVFKATGS